MKPPFEFVHSAADHLSQKDLSGGALGAEEGGGGGYTAALQSERASEGA